MFSTITPSDWKKAVSIGRKNAERRKVRISKCLILTEIARLLDLRPFVVMSIITDGYAPSFYIFNNDSSGHVYDISSGIDIDVNDMFDDSFWMRASFINETIFLHHSADIVCFSDSCASEVQAALSVIRERNPVTDEVFQEALSRIKVITP